MKLAKSCSLITKASGDRLELWVGKEVVALVKASNVILAVDEKL